MEHGLVIRAVFFSLFVVTASYAPPEVKPDDLDLVLDIDNVLTFADDRARALSPEVQEVLLRMGVLARANNKIYRVAHGAGVFIQALTHIHGSRVSFYSAHAQTGRTAEILGQIHLPNGKTAWKIAHNILFRPSTVQLRLLPPEHRMKYQAAWSIFNPPPDSPQEKKDLMKVTWVPNLARTFLFDDAIANAMPGQEKNLVWSKPEFGVYELTRLRGLLDLALEKAKRRDQKPIDVMFELQWLAGSRDPGQNLQFDKVSAVDEVLLRGYEKMRKEDPLFEFEADYLKVIDSGSLQDALALEQRWKEWRDRGVIARDLPEILRQERVEVPGNGARKIAAVNHGYLPAIAAFPDRPALAVPHVPPLPHLAVPHYVDPLAIDQSAQPTLAAPAFSLPIDNGQTLPQFGSVYVGPNTVVMAGPWGTVEVPVMQVGQPQNGKAAAADKPPGRIKACLSHLYKAGRALVMGGEVK